LIEASWTRYLTWHVEKLPRWRFVKMKTGQVRYLVGCIELAVANGVGRNGVIYQTSAESTFPEHVRRAILLNVGSSFPELSGADIVAWRQVD